MVTLFDVVGTIAFVGLFVNTIVGLCLMHLLLRRLRAERPTVWERLGSPSLIMSNTIGNGLSSTGFILSRQHKGLGDRRISILVLACRLSMGFQVVALVTVMVWMTNIKNGN